MPDETRTSGELPDRPDLPYKKIGRFTLRRVIATGGMGTVFEAMQERPRRIVAIKVMKHGVTSREALKRFEFESQLLARLKHPGIAEVYEAGTHDDGTGPVPYFAMEYVPKATSIVSFVKAKGMSLRDRLLLFARVCDAVNHGHQKGIVHRDLKPDNIIVSPDGRPKIIDFGVARATDSDVALATLQTEYGQLVGTLQYMSPEQVSAESHDVDIRSDVYSLGVILYEIIAERRPYDLSKFSPVESARRIQEETPPHLSTTVRGVSGDLATITHKALEKDRDRRYQSAGELAADVRRFLEDQPIAARPPTIRYQIKVFARRNRVLVGSALALFLVLIAAFATSTTLYLRAERERIKAERHSRRSLAAIGLVREVVESTKPAFLEQDVNVAKLLERFSDRLEEAFPEDPDIEAAVRTSIALLYRDLDRTLPKSNTEGYLTAAQEHLERAYRLRTEVLGERHEETVEAARLLSDLLVARGEYEEAERLARYAWSTTRDLHGAGDPQTIAAMLDVADSLSAQGRLEESVRMVREAYSLYTAALGESDERTVACKARLARLVRREGRPEESEQLCRQLLLARDPSERERPSRDPTIRDLASALLAQGKVDEARTLYGDWRVPLALEVTEWYQGRLDLSGKNPILVLYFHEGCPFSHRFVPGVASLYRRYRDEGLRMVGVRNPEWFDSTEEAARAFIDEKGLTFPVANAAPGFGATYDFRGVPQLAMVVSGAVVWRGHPNELGSEVIEGALAAVKNGELDEGEGHV